ncbi:hypothetical protein [Zhihengliuella salsuginis]|uniref:Uncharacterized protein n=1 Tax=Zhihengliuella salsuginis TaxID=578222 RepID=A0ABQ3GL61_9MICC|nr:hypothetical protein [Zhihengliuella salsuginis]GHD11008.1 hypothetical protein GCM10008096_25150 [Zhihengliuella salsuginis]
MNGESNSEPGPRGLSDVYPDGSGYWAPSPDAVKPRVPDWMERPALDPGRAAHRDRPPLRRPTAHSHVVGFGAWCELEAPPRFLDAAGRPEQGPADDSLSVSILVFCRLDDGRAVLVAERGFTVSAIRVARPRPPVESAGQEEHDAAVAPPSTGRRLRGRMSPAQIEEDVRACLQPDEPPEDDPDTDSARLDDELAYDDFAWEARGRGLDVTADALRGMDFTVELSPRLREWASESGTAPSSG